MPKPPIRQGKSYKRVRNLKMKQNYYLKRAGCYLLSLWFTMPSTVVAQSYVGQGGPQGVAGGDPIYFNPNPNGGSGPNAGAQLMSALQGVGNATLTVIGQMQQMKAYQQQMAQMQSLYPQPIPPNQIPPLFAQSGCQILPAKTQQLGPGSKCEAPMDPSQAQQYNAMLSVSFQIQNLYSNFATEGNAKGGVNNGPAYSGQGVSCYNRALKNFQAMLDARLQRIDKLTNFIDERMALFEKMAEKDLEGVKRGEALLTGKDPNGLLKDVRFEDNFKDPQCNSFLTVNDIKKAGQTGFTGIKDMLDSKMSDRGNGNLAPKELLSKSGDYERDIESLANQVAKKLQDKELSNEFNKPDELNLISETGIDQSPAFQNLLKQQINEKQEQFNAITKDFGDYSSGSGNTIGSFNGDAQAGNILNKVLTGSGNLETYLLDYENGYKDACFNDYLAKNFGSGEKLAKELYDPNVSRKSNREADSAFKNYVASILANDNYTIEEKRKMIREEESKSRNSRYTMVLGKSVNINGRTIGASARLKASDMVDIFVSNCVAKYQSSTNSQGKSPAQVAQKLRDIAAEYDRFKKTFVSEVKGKITSEMLRCPNDNTTGKAANSCDGAMNISSAKFCLKTAKMCAANVNACLEKATSIYDRTRAEQKQYASRYRANVEKLKVDLVREFKMVDAYMEQQSRALDTLYEGGGSLYKVPVDLNFDLLSDKMLQGVDPSLMLEDPRKYKEQIKDNLKNLRAQVEQHNNEIMNGNPNDRTSNKGLYALVNKYQENYRTQEQDWKKIMNDCKSRMDEYAQAMAQQQQQQQEMINKQNEEIAKVCREVDAYNQNPRPSCDKSGELADDLLKIAAVSGDSSAIAELRQHQAYCDSANSDTTGNYYMASGGSEKQIDVGTADQFCDDPKYKATGQPECIRYMKLHGRLTAKGGRCPDDYDGLEDFKKVLRESYANREQAGEDDKVVCRVGNTYAYTDKKLCDVRESEVKEGETPKKSIVYLNPTDFDEASDEAAKRQIAATYTKKGPKKCDINFESSEAAQDLAEAAGEVRILQNQYSQAQQLSDIGPVRVPTCHGINNGGIGKEFGQFAEQVGRGVAEANSMGMGMGQMGARY